MIILINIQKTNKAKKGKCRKKNILFAAQTKDIPASLSGGKCGTKRRNASPKKRRNVPPTAAKAVSKHKAYMQLFANSWFDYRPIAILAIRIASGRPMTPSPFTSAASRDAPSRVSTSIA